MSAVLGTFVSIKTMADGSPRIVLDLQCTLADIAALGMIPGTPFGIARITAESTIAPVAEKEPAERPGQLCVMACNFCKDPMFWKWSGMDNEADAKQYILERLAITSRKEIDNDKHTADDFHCYIRSPYLAWRNQQ